MDQSRAKCRAAPRTHAHEGAGRSAWGALLLPVPRRAEQKYVRVTAGATKGNRPRGPRRTHGWVIADGGAPARERNRVSALAYAIRRSCRGRAFVPRRIRSPRRRRPWWLHPSGRTSLTAAAARRVDCCFQPPCLRLSRPEVVLRGRLVSLGRATCTCQDASGTLLRRRGLGCVIDQVRIVITEQHGVPPSAAASFASAKASRGLNCRREALCVTRHPVLWSWA
jgi:hypothetical protein